MATANARPPALSGAPPGEPPAPERATPSAREVAARSLGALALTTIVLLVLAIVVAAAERPSFLSPFTRPGFFPSWMAGPLAGLLPSLTRDDQRLRALTSGAIAILFVSYLVALRFGPRLRARWVIAAIVAVHVVLLCSPPLFSTDVFNYLNYGRMGVVHDLNPYTSIPLLEPHGDPTFAISNWHRLLSPYGPLFTLLTYALVPLGVAASFWTVKAIIALASLGTLALVWRCAELLGRPRRAAIVLVGLNPLVLVWGLGADHNDALMMLLVMLALYLTLRACAAGRGPASPPPAGAGAGAGAARGAGAAPGAGAGPAPGATPAARAGAALGLLRRVDPADRLAAAAGAALVTAVAVKASAAILLPVFLLAGRWRAKLVGALGVGLVLAGASALAFGPHLPDLTTQSRLVTPLGFANVLGVLLGLGGETSGLHAVLDVILVATVLGAAMVTAREPRHALGAAFACMLVLPLTLSWTGAWYVLWVLPFAALLSGWRARAAVLALTAFLLLAFLPDEPLVHRPLSLPLYSTALGRAHSDEINALLH